MVEVFPNFSALPCSENLVHSVSFCLSRTRVQLNISFGTEISVTFCVCRQAYVFSDTEVAHKQKRILIPSNVPFHMKHMILQCMMLVSYVIIRTSQGF